MSLSPNGNFTMIICVMAEISGYSLLFSVSCFTRMLISPFIIVDYLVHIIHTYTYIHLYILT